MPITPSKHRLPYGKGILYQNYYFVNIRIGDDLWNEFMQQFTSKLEVIPGWINVTHTGYDDVKNRWSHHKLVGIVFGYEAYHRFISAYDTAKLIIYHKKHARKAMPSAVRHLKPTDLPF